MIPKLGKLLADLPRTGEFVFSYRGRPIKDIKTSWNGTLRRAGVAAKTFTFHTMRHTTATWLHKATKDLRLVQKVLGHADIKTTTKYAHLIAEEEAKAMDEAFV
ncbi:MAG: tyrosine-type recombinase/integrase [Rickettsiales bacterium]|jgi:integrase|nr:tyrosine-type recombinase/integrase [Rickettsiales bacterium]